MSSLTADQLAAYRRDGFMHLPGVFTTAEVAAWRRECDRLLASDLVHADNLRTRFRPHPAGGQLVEKFDPVSDVSPLFRAVCDDPRLLGPVAEVMGEPARLFKDKVIFKPSGADGYGAHQDWAWWQVFPSAKLLSAMVAVDAADADNGVLELVPGRHQRFLTPIGAMRGLSDDELVQCGLTEWEAVPTQPGDVLLFHCLTPHRSGRNTSPGSRRQLYPTYAPASLGNLWPAHYEHYRWYVEQGLSEAERGRLGLW